MVRYNGSGCAVCGEKATVKDLCKTHYDRLRQHGNFDSARPADWGQRSKHPLWERWKYFAKAGRHPDWADFWTFVRAVGEPPTPRARLNKLRQGEPIGPDNWTWNEVWAAGVGKDGGLSKREYMREWNRRNPGKARGYEMKRHRGISMAEYDATFLAQGGVCAICGENDSVFRLAIDHDHDTGANRGLLCSNCNRGLGLLGDKVERVKSALAYLQKWKSE